jgi:hypothetical protein
VEEIITVVEDMYMIHEKIPVKQPKPHRRQTQLLTEEGQSTMIEEKVLDSTLNMQMTITSTELFRGGSSQ